MRLRRSVTARRSNALLGSDHAAGLFLGAAGILVFSFTFPATKLALRGFDPWFIAFGRASVAGVLAALTLRHQRAARPSARQCLRLAVVATGVVVGFPVLSTLALQSSSSAHSAVVIAMLPAATAIVGALRAGESPGPRFWLAAATGAGVVGGYAVAHAHGGLALSDLYLLGAVAVCAVGYAEGAVLSRSLGAPQTICWALVIAWPLTLPGALVTLPTHFPDTQALAGFGYVSVCSQFLGFFAWYAGLARGGVAHVSQVQLAQTPLTLVWSAIVLGEPVGPGTALVALAVLVSVAATQRARVTVAGRDRARVAQGARPQLAAASSSGGSASVRPGSAHSGSISSG